MPRNEANKENVSIPLFNLTKDINETELGGYLSNKDLLNIGLSCQAGFGIFQPILNKKQVSHLLYLVAYGKQNEVEAQLAKSFKRFFEYGDLTDNAGRCFEKITPFQYALWARDTHLWALMLAYIKNSPEDFAKAKEQYNSVITQGLNYQFKSPLINFGTQIKNESHYPLQDFIKCAEDYIKTYNKKLFIVENKKWVGGIGAHQREFPINIAQQYCEPKIAFTGKKDFKTKLFTRKLDFKLFHSTAQWCSTKLNSICHEQLGLSFAIRRGQNEDAHASQSSRHDVQHDVAALKQLDQIRSEEITLLGQYLDNSNKIVLPEYLTYEMKKGQNQTVKLGK